MAAASSSTTVKAERETFYPVKWVVEETGRSIPIALQGANGPCALLALLNVQFQRGNLTVPPGSESVAESLAMNMLASLAMAASPDKLQHFVELLPSLRKGMHVNVRFFSPTAFEHTKEIAAFDCFPDVKLLHGWLVDPQDERLVQAFSDLSYNQIMDEMVGINAREHNAGGQTRTPTAAHLNPERNSTFRADDATIVPNGNSGCDGDPVNNGGSSIALASYDNESKKPPSSSYETQSFSSHPVNDLDLIDVSLPPHLLPSAPPESPVDVQLDNVPVHVDKSELLDVYTPVVTGRAENSNLQLPDKPAPASVPLENLLVEPTEKVLASLENSNVEGSIESAPAPVSVVERSDMELKVEELEKLAPMPVPVENSTDVDLGIKGSEDTASVRVSDESTPPIDSNEENVKKSPSFPDLTTDENDSNVKAISLEDFAPCPPPKRELNPEQMNKPVSPPERPAHNENIEDSIDTAPPPLTEVGRHTARIWEFFASFPTHLTYHGIAEINSLLAEGETSILFRNSHFYVLRKRKGDLYTLVTDVGFQREPDIAWEILRDINGDSDFYSALFFPSVPGTGAAAAQKSAENMAPPPRPVMDPATSSPPRSNATLSSRTQCAQQRRPRPSTRPPPSIPPGKKKFERTKDDNCVLM